MIKNKTIITCLILGLSFLLSSCGVADAIQDIISDDDSASLTQKNENIGKKINYKVQAADFAQVKLGEVTDEQVVTFFSKIFKTTVDSVQSQTGLKCNSAIIYYLNESGEKVLYPTNQSIISYNENFPGIQLTVNGDYLYVRTYNSPNHQSEYFLNSGSTKSCGQGYADGVAISGFYTTFVLPLNSEITYSTDLSNNAIGIALNGVLLFSNEVYTDNGTQKIRTITSEKNALDSYMGRSSSTNGYYYLAEPGYFTGYDYKKVENSNNGFSIQTYSTSVGRDALIGFSRDGFPIYGPYEYGTTSKPTDLDECRGHYSNTGSGSLTSFGEVYHYHVEAFEDINSSSPALIGCFSGISP